MKLKEKADQAKAHVRNAVQKIGVGASALLASGAAFAGGGGTGLDTAEITALIADSQTKGVAIAGGVTLMLFMFAGAKWLRRAK